MPYIKKQDRELLDENLAQISELIQDMSGGDNMFRPGFMNYVITKIIKNVYGAFHDQEIEEGLGHQTMRYADYNEVIGMLESCKLEFYRRHVSPYEDKKIQQNGDV